MKRRMDRSITVLSLLWLGLQWSHAQLMAVQLNPGETMGITFSHPVPVRIPIGVHDLTMPTWSVSGGELLSVTETGLTYRAPLESGLYLLIWEGGTERAEVLVHVPPELECTETVAPLEINKQLMVPTVNAAPFVIYFQTTTGPPRGPTICLIKGRPIAGERLTGKCERDRQQDREKRYTQTYARELGDVTVTSELAAQLAAIGIRVTVGVRIKIEQQVQRTTKMRLIDCYKCVNGRLKLEGSRVEYVFCDYVSYLSPSWACQAISVIMLPSCGLHPSSHCRPIGDCDCPKGASFYGCP